MLKRSLITALVAIQLVAASTAVGRSTARVMSLTLTAEEVKAKVLRIGSGLKARVRVRLTDGTSLKGFIDRSGAESFVVIRTDTGHIGSAVVIAYEDVTQLRGKGGSIDRAGVARATLAAGRVAHEILKGIRIQLPPQPRR
ncbi:MAG: hypothetical protein H0T45_01070 [Pyrinomonadaceae bacterium]|nr:hypothetical protein [Pyrinomonadaceae bacterium]MDQ3135048.1 hypothetical protein [Acidobacteriota bacterium]